METVLITGATSGIGEAIARDLAQHQYRLIICGRREDRLQYLKKELSAHTEATYLSFDVRFREQVDNAMGTLSDEWKSVDVLVNNAGNAHGMAPIDQGSVDDWDAMVDINVKGLLYVSRAIIPGMVARKKGHIINIGSIAGQEVYPQGNVYCASKFAVEALSRGMRMDLNPHEIRVTAINPGLVDTEFSLVRFKGDANRAKSVYQGMTPLSGKDIAEIVTFVLSRPAHVNLSDITVLPSAQASATLVKRD